EAARERRRLLRQRLPPLSVPRERAAPRKASESATGLALSFSICCPAAAGLADSLTRGRGSTDARVGDEPQSKTAVIRARRGRPVFGTDLEVGVFVRGQHRGLPLRESHLRTPDSHRRSSAVGAEATRSPM